MQPGRAGTLTGRAETGARRGLPGLAAAVAGTPRLRQKRFAARSRGRGAPRVCPPRVRALPAQRLIGASVPAGRIRPCFTGISRSPVSYRYYTGIIPVFTGIIPVTVFTGILLVFQPVFAGISRVDNAACLARRGGGCDGEGGPTGYWSIDTGQ